MLQFIPVTDAYLEHDPALYLRLVPFNIDYPCRRLALEPTLDSTLESTRESALEPRVAVAVISKKSSHQGESHE
jgi:hypothetical protein